MTLEQQVEDIMNHEEASMGRACKLLDSRILAATAKRARARREPLVGAAVCVLYETRSPMDEQLGSLVQTRIVVASRDTGHMMTSSIVESHWEGRS